MKIFEIFEESTFEKSLASLVTDYLSMVFGSGADSVTAQQIIDAVQAKGYDIDEFGLEELMKDLSYEMDGETGEITYAPNKDEKDDLTDIGDDLGDIGDDADLGADTEADGLDDGDFTLDGEPDDMTDMEDELTTDDSIRRKKVAGMASNQMKKRMSS